MVRTAAGCFLTIQSTVLADLMGVNNIVRAQAFLLMFVGVGGLVSVPLAGFLLLVHSSVMLFK